METRQILRRDELTTKQRRWGAVVAIALILVGFAIWYFPPNLTSVELDSAGKVVKTLKEQPDAVTQFVVLVVGGLIILGFVLNGLKFSKISAVGVSAEVKDPGQSAEEYYERTAGEKEEEEISVDDKNSPEPNESPITYIERDDARYAVYSLTAVPASVVVDAMQKWPESLSKPDDFSAFEFATRKTGKGNHPWTIKFKGFKPVTVSYGGYGKTEPTVGEAI